MPIDTHSHVPIYEQIVEHIRGSMAAGVFCPGEPLPSIRTLALELTVTPNTVQRAYQELERQGLVHTRKGLGVFVAEDGDASAQVKSETAVQTRFSEGIAIGLSAKLPAERIRTLFHRAMESSGNTPSGHSDLARKDETLEPDSRS